MTLHDLIRFAKAYDRLGTAIQRQLDSVLDGDDLNPNALVAIDSNLRGYNDDLDTAISDALAATELPESI